MILQYLFFVNIKGSKSVVCAREGGSNTTLLFPAVLFAKQKMNLAASRSEGAAEGGCGGNSAAPERWSPAALLVQSRTPKKSFVFLLEEKIRRAQKEIRKQNFSLVERALASGGGANQLPFRSRLRLSASVGQAKKVRAKCKISPPKNPHLYFNGDFLFSISSLPF
jgi:hypothetical protein